MTGILFHAGNGLSSGVGSLKTVGVAEGGLSVRVNVIDGVNVGLGWIVLVGVGVSVGVAVGARVWVTVVVYVLVGVGKGVSVGFT